MKPSEKGNTVLVCIDEDICAGGSYHCLFIIFAVLFVPSAKKEAQEAFDAKLNCVQVQGPEVRS
jgi:hypothetical protein